MHVTHRPRMLMCFVCMLVLACEKHSPPAGAAGDHESTNTAGASWTSAPVVRETAAPAETTQKPDVKYEPTASESIDQPIAVKQIQDTQAAHLQNDKVLSNIVMIITTWVDTWFINTQIHAYADCTNILQCLPEDRRMRLAVQEVLSEKGSPYAAVAAFITWAVTGDDAARASALAAMQRYVTANTWPFYEYAMRNTATNVARAHLVPPDELLTRVFAPHVLWDGALVGLGNFYRDCAGEDALITYWNEIKARRPALAGAAVVHQIAAAQRLNDADRVICLLRENIDAVRQAQWTVERAIWTLNTLSHPDVLALSNALVAPRN